MDFEERSEEMMEVAEPSEEIEVETSEESPEVAEPESEESVDEGRTKNDSDAAFAQMRREKQELERRIAELESANSEYDETLGLFFDGDNKIAKAHAHYNSTSVEDEERALAERRESHKLADENERLSNELNDLRYERQKMADLKEIKKVHPDASIEDVEELGEKFFAYRTMDISAVDAYEAIQMQKNKNKPPKAMGKVKASPPQKDFFTRDEVEAMSQAEVKKNFEKIRNSMSKWK